MKTREALVCEKCGMAHDWGPLRCPYCRLVKVRAELKRMRRDYEVFEALAPPDVPRRQFVKWCFDAWETVAQQDEP